MLFPGGVAKAQKHGCTAQVPSEGGVAISVAYSSV